jgi:hypothetical protein
MHTQEDWFFTFILVLIWAYFSITLSYFIGVAIFDPTFFTYITYFANWLFYGIFYASLFSYPAFEFVVMFVFPLIYGMTVFVFFAIVVIVGINDEVYTRATILGGTTRTFGEEFVGNFVIHVMPTVFMFVSLIALAHYVGPLVNMYWKTSSKSEIAGYLLWVLLGPSVVLSLYMATMPFEKNYMVPWSSGVVVTLELALSILVQALLVGLVLLFTNWRPISEKQLHTPMGYRF